MLLGNAALRLERPDVIEGLPETTSRRVLAARLRRDEAAAVQRAINDQIEEHRARRDDWIRQLQLLQRQREARSPAFGGPQPYIERPEVAALDGGARHNARLAFIAPGDTAQIVELKTKIDRAFQEMRRLALTCEPHTHRTKQRMGVVRNIEDFLRRGLSLRPLAEPNVKFKGSVLDAIDERRRRNRNIIADIAEAEAAPYPAEEVKAGIEAHFEFVKAARGPSVERMIFGDKFAWPMLPMKATPVLQPAERLLIAWEQMDIEAVLISTMGDTILKRLFAEVDASLAELKAAGATPLSSAERACRVADLQRDLLANQRDEAALIEHAHSQGLPVEFDPETSPLALLNVELDPVS